MLNEGGLTGELGSHVERGRPNRQTGTAMLNEGGLTGELGSHVERGQPNSELGCQDVRYRYSLFYITISIQHPDH